MKQLHSDLIALANDFGADEQYCRAGGGNASVKHDGVLYIKPSGVPLATLRDEDLVPLRLDVLLDALFSTAPVVGDPVRAAAQAAQIGATSRRPSVEILFHALLPEPLVLHLHPLVANAVTCNEHGPELTAQLLGDQALWVDYIDPGVPLAQGIAAAREAYTARTKREAPSVTLLGNHGIIVAGDSYAEVAERTRWLTHTVSSAIGAPPPVTPVTGVDVSALAEAFQAATASAHVAVATDGLAVSASAADAAPVARGPLIPDQIVYAGSFPLVLSDTDDAAQVADKVADFQQHHGRSPIIAVVPHAAVFAAGSQASAATTALGTFLDALHVARDADLLGRAKVLDEAQRHFIEHWEAEAYRKQVASGS